MSKFNTFEKEIKKAVLNHLLNKGELKKEVTIVNELTIDSFSRRVDLAILTDKKIIAYEIKSDADSLYRLSGQLEKYRQYFDKTIVVTTPKHLENILKMVSDDIEVWEVLEQKITIKKRGKLSRIGNKASYLDLLRVQDMRRLASTFKLPLSKGGKKEIKSTLTTSIDDISYEKLKLFVLNVISQRFKLTSTVFLENIIVGNKVTINDLNFLSPYFEIRKQYSLVKGSVLEQLK
ncbi:sce7726 family protein [Arsenophonus apicola]|uniref:Sce7726 family protein n=1 Tax=Arsenophonus apicola TaxID=2879119 RepID=A0ABY8P282_9GAMM|nr:sce7726 family protein [Arsenophonus apicola]WGO83618.1 sce7726 family protein [Arsenophonus apicola]